MEIKINPNKEKDNIFWAFCEIIEDDKRGADLISNAKRYSDGFIFDIDLKINGKEFDFVKVINRLVESQNRIIEKAVKNELENKFYDIISATQNIIDDLDNIKTKINE